MSYFHFLLLFIFSIPAFGSSNVESLRRSIYKIHTVSQDLNFVTPWIKHRLSRSSGTGFYIGGNRILTNAHVVTNAKFVSVQRDSDDKKITAEITYIAHDSDLAILTVKQKKYFDNTPILEFGNFPKIGSPVVSMGFPMGGEQISTTEGVISRIGYRNYVHSYQEHLLIQVDSAINPGNSGGPVFQDSKVVGVAFQSNKNAENTGYIIPIPVVNRFLKDIEDKLYEGHVHIGLAVRKFAAANSSAKRFYGISEKNKGAILRYVAPWSQTYSFLSVGDTLLKVDGYPIGVDGKINFVGERVHFKAYLDLKLIGDQVEFQYIHKGNLKKKTVATQKNLPHFSWDTYYGKKPRYYIASGLIFRPLTLNYLQEWGKKWYRKAPANLKSAYTYANTLKQFKNSKDIIIFDKRLPHRLNKYIGDQKFETISHVNGTPILSFEQFIEILNEKHKDYLIEFHNNQEPIYIKSKDRKNIDLDIKKTYQIPQLSWDE